MEAEDMMTISGMTGDMAEMEVDMTTGMDMEVAAGGGDSMTTTGRVAAIGRTS